MVDKRYENIQRWIVANRGEGKVIGEIQREIEGGKRYKDETVEKGER